MKLVFRISFAAFVCAAAVAACRSPERNDSRASDTATRPDTVSGMAAMSDMAAMPGMSAQMGGMMSAGMMDSVRAHLRAMDTVSAEQMRKMLAVHRPMVANMLSRMTDDMRSMNMTGDRQWAATVDSLREDLSLMPGMSAPELRAMMPAHMARMTRLMQMHSSMMKAAQ